MNLKKIGSALTAVSMIASMATYVPVVHAAEEVEDTIYTVVLDEADYNVDVTVSLNVTDSHLIVSSVDGADAAYNVYADYLMDEIAYEFIGDKNASDYSNVATLAEACQTIEFTGDVSIRVGEESDAKIVGSSATTKIMADCRGEIVGIDENDEAIETLIVTEEYLGYLSDYEGEDEVSGEVVHEMIANPDSTRKNHICAHGDKIDNTFSAHIFEPVEGKGYHACYCGKLDTDYLNTVVDGVNLYETIHGFTNEDHYCDDCGAYNQVYHVGTNLTYTTTADTHTVACKKDGDTDCGYAKAAEKHTWAYNSKYVVEEGQKEDGTLEVAGNSIPVNSHYCTVCGYVILDDDKNTTGHTYNSKVVAYKDANGNFAQKVVETSVAAEQAVCACGAVKPGHGDTTKHVFVGAYGTHMCVCGTTQNVHSHDFIYTGTGVYEVNGQVGFAYDTDKGIVCSCGAVDLKSDNNADGHECLVAVDGDTDIVDTKNNKHYCTCGKEITTTEGTKEVAVHNYEAIEDKHEHRCECGAVSEDAHTWTHVYDPEADENVEADPASTNAALCGTCGAVNPAHTTHKYEIYNNQKHYCVCGEENTVHDYTITNGSETTCACGALKNHTHTLDENCDCTNKVCGAKGLHEYTLSSNKTHICKQCGISASEADAKNDGHVFVANTETQEHVCECGLKASEYGEDGLENDGHTYDATTKVDGKDVIDHICNECGFENHTATTTKTDSNGNIYHVCECGYAYTEDEDYGHIYDDDYKCTIDDCEAIKEHDCAFDHQATEDEVDSAKGIVTGDELCACGKEVAHEYALASNAGEHACTHVNDDVICDYSESHDFGTNSKGTFCIDCGAVNPAVLEDARDIVIGDYVGEYTTAYVVKLQKAVDAVLAYDIVDSKNESGYKTVTEENPVSVAVTADEQAAFEALLADLEAVLDDASNNQARSCMIIAYVGDSADYAVLDEEYLGKEVKYVYDQVGKEVTLSVVPKAGYQIEGWYSDAEGKNLVTNDKELTVTIKDGSTTYYANIVMNDTVAINIAKNMKYSSTISTENSEEKGWGADVDFAINEKVTIYYEGTDFLYFKNKLGNTFNEKNGVTKVGNKYSYTFTVTSGDAFTVETSVDSSELAAAEMAYVIFKNKVEGSAVEKVFTIRTLKVTNSTVNISDVMPTVPSRIGMTFKGWANEENPTKVVKQKAVEALSGATVILVPVFEKETGLKLTFKGLGSFVDKADATTNSGDGFTYGDVVGITAPEKSNGKYFSGWYENGSLVDAARTTYYTIKGNSTLEAKYENDEPAEAISYVALTAEEATNASGNRVVNLKSKWTILDSAEVLETGFVFSFKGVTGDALVIGSDNVNQSKGSSTSANSDATLPLTLKSAATKDANVNARAYVMYRSTSGEVVTMYSDEVVSVKPAN